jgi:hypothetical protein
VGIPPKVLLGRRPSSKLQTGLDAADSGNSIIIKGPLVAMKMRSTALLKLSSSPVRIFASSGA